jgi:P-type conjugative transfer protein TrbJ
MITLIVSFAVPALAQIPPFPFPIPPAGGGIPVFDAAAEATRLQQLQLEQQNTYAGSAGIWQSNEQFLTQLGALIKQQTGISYSDPQLIQIFEQLYPGYNTQMAAPSPEASVDTNLNTLNGTLQDAQAQNQSYQSEQTTLAGLELDNQSALGNLQVSQTGNEIALISVQQQQTIRQLIMALLNSYNVNSAAAVNAQTASQLSAMAIIGAPPQVLALSPPGPPAPVISSGGDQ